MGNFAVEKGRYRIGLSLMSSAVSEVQFPIANGSVSSLLNLRNNILRARSLQIVGGRHRNLESC